MLNSDPFQAAHPRCQTAVAQFLKREDGAVTPASLFLFVVMVALLGLSVDVSNAYWNRTELQVAADSSAHAALYLRETMSEDEAKEKAIALAADVLRVDPVNAEITADDIEFGTWNADTRTFTPAEHSRAAVRVTTTRTEERENPVDSYLLRIVGRNHWDVSTQSVVETFRPTCLTEGFVAEGVVDIQSNNEFSNGFCMHSNSYVSINQNNYFESGTVVSMPSLDDLDIPNSGLEKNDGLEEALRESFYNIRVLDRVDTILNGLRDLDVDVIPDYITATSFKTLTGKTIATSSLQPGGMYILACNSGNKVTIDSNTSTTIHDVVILASCPVYFAHGAVFENAIIGNFSTSDNSFNSPSDVTLGKDDHCAEGGGVQLVTRGGVDFAAGLNMYGSQIIALGDVQFAANADGVEGAAIIAGGRIDGTSNMSMGYCGSGMEDNFEVDYFRMVQ